MKRLAFISIVIFVCNCVTAQKVTVSGNIYDYETGEVLIGANIYDKETGKGMASNEYGYFSLTFDHPGKVAFACSYLGYNDTIISVSLTESIILNIFLKPGVDIGEVKISSQANKPQSTHGSIDLPVKQVRMLPSFGGEFDLMKTLQLMPGIQSGNEGNSGLYVRGGGPDQNLVLLDDVPLYYVNHLAGFISTFNSDAINNVKLIKGGFPPGYGGRLSSILDIRMKDGNMKQFKGSGSIGLVSSKIALEGPIKKDTSSFIISARRFMYDLITMPLTKLSEDNMIGYTFYDLNMKLNHKFSEKDRIFLSWYSGDDSSVAIYNNTRSDNDKSIAKVRWGNMMSAFRWNHVYNRNLFSNLSLTYTRFRFNTTAKDRQEVLNGVTNYKGVFRSSIGDLGAKFDFSFYPAHYQTINFGAGSVYHNFHPWSNSYNITEGNTVTLDTVTGNRNLYAWEHYAYLQDKINIGNFINFELGGRGTWYVSDEMSYKHLEPRLSLNILPGDKTQVSASYSEMQQYVHLLSYSNVGIPIDLWMPATKDVPPLLSKQISLGLTRSFKENQFDLSLEYYNKWMNNLIAYKTGVSIIESTEDWQGLIEKGGKGRSWGVEVMIRKNLGATTGWIGYTWSKTTRQFDNLNQGKPFPYKFDRRHDISFVMSHKINDNIDISATWVYGTGNAFTIPVGKYNSIMDLPQYWGSGSSVYVYPGYIYDGKNNFRMRSYHRLDVGINFKKETRRGEGIWNISVFNLYNRKNPYYYYIDYDWTSKTTTLKQKSLFPIMPSVSYSFYF